jgi:hypothetical protein
MKIGCYLKRLRTVFRQVANQSATAELHFLALGKLLSENSKNKRQIDSLSDVEFKVFSQWGDDGIIQWLVNHIDFPNKTFMEFGVSHYREATTRFLLMNNNWSGFVMDGSAANVEKITNSEYYTNYELIAKAAFIDADNVNSLLLSSNFEKEVGILHIDLDGNDYWIWRKIEVVSPIVVILEYNSVFGIDRPITVPYDKTFDRTNAHFSNLYFGASLSALHQLSAEKGYSFIGCTSSGNNAYFVRNDKLNDVVKKTSLENGYVVSKFREGRDRNGNLTFLTGPERLEAIKGLPVYNINTDQIEKL